MKKRVKGLISWWLALVMLFSTLATPAMALPSNRIYIYAGTEPLKANDELYPYVREGVSEGTQLSSLVPLGDGVTLTGWNLWEFDNINSGYVITDKLLTKDTDWTLSADDVEKYATGDYYAFEPIYSGQIAIYTDADEVEVDEFVGDYQVVSATTGVPVSEQASVIDVIDSSKTLEGWDIWSAGWSGYHSGTVWNERISEESADYTLSSKYFVTSDDLKYYLVPVYGAAPPHKHPICGAEHTDIGDHTGTCENVDWTAWDGTTDFPGGNVYLSADVTLEKTLEISSGTVNLCLNGKVLRISENAIIGAVIEVSEGATLNICDCRTTEHKFSPDESGLWVLDEENGTKSVSGGVITGGNTTVGSAIRSDGTLRIYGGNIVGNHATARAVVHSTGAEFSMYGGSIYGNTGAEGNYGVGLCLWNNTGKQQIRGGKIYENTAAADDSPGGVGVYVSQGNLTISGAVEIYDNKRGIENDNIYVAWNRSSQNEYSLIIDGKLTNTTPIGVWARYEDIIIKADGTNVTDLTEYMDHFTPDNTGRELQLSVDKQSIKLLPPHIHPICGGEHSDIGDHTGNCEDITWTAVSTEADLKSMMSGGSYYLKNDIELTSTLFVSNINLCLNGFELRQSGNFAVIQPNAGVTLNICDCSEEQTGTIAGGHNSDGAGIYASGGSGSTTTVNIYGGNIIDCEFGAGIGLLYDTTANIYNGKITGNNGGYGGVYCYYGATLNMYGGEISGNTATYAGGGIWLYRSTLNVSGDVKISGNTLNGSPNNLHIEVNESDPAVVSIGEMADNSDIGVTIGKAGYKEVDGEYQQYVEFLTGTISANGASYIDNFFSDVDEYMLATDGEGLKLVEKPTTCAVAFNANGGTTVSGQTVEYGSKIEEPTAPTKSGYTFAGWYKDSELAIAWDFDTDTVTEPTTLYAKWTANTNTPYVVNHWVQTLDAAINGNAEKNETNYTLNEDENLTGTTDATFKANTKEIDGFKAPDKESITIAANGSTVHNYYYTRNKYNIVINTNEGVEALSGNGQYYYEQNVDISASLKSGYKWSEWVANETGYGSANISYSFNMPATALVLSPKTTSKAEVSINTDVQSYTYDKSAKAFEIRETDLTGFTVSYEQNGIAVTPINAGFYDVILSRAEDENYKEYSKTLANGLIINKVIIDEPLIIDKPYNGLAQTADISDTEIYEVTENAGGTNVGAYDVVLTLKDTVNYKWRMEENSGATATRKFFITFTENTWDVEPQITGWTFGQEPREPTFDAKFGEVVVEYKKASEEDSSYTTDIPENAGNYKVKFTVEATTNFGSLSEILDLTIAKAIPSLEAPTAQNDITYGAAISTVGLTEGWTWLDGTTIPTVQNSGFVAYFTPADTANYDWTGIDGWNEVESRVEKTVSVTVTKADSSIAAAPTAILNLEYDGSAKALVNAGTANGGTMQYSLDGTTWSTDIPTRTDAGVYDVHYKVTGDANHNDNEGGTVQVTIAKATQSAPETPAAVNETIKAKADGKITGVNSDMEYKLEGASEYIAISETEIVNLAAGTYLVRYKENANHLAGADKQLIIADGAMITVSFNSNEGTAVDSITCEYNQAITVPAEPTKENFVFAGWYKDAECLDLWNFSNTLTEDITLYAKWNDKPVYSVSGKVTDGEFGLGGINVTLKQGNTIIATTTTAADGSYSFITEDGLYNIVAEKEENDNSTIKTVKIEVIESADVNDVVFVATDINSELEIKPDTPQIIVGGLDEEAQTVSSSNGNVDVTVKMTVESAEDITGSDDATGQEQRQTEQKEIKKVSGNRYIQFIEINLTQSISGAESTKLEETSGLIEIIIPFEKGNKRNITVYRYHGSASEKLGAGIGNANADGEYFEVKENHIVVYAKKFSTYAIGYDLPSSGGGGSSVTRYTVKFDTNGGSSVSSATVTKNTKVAEPKTPEKDGYTFGGWYTDKEFAEKYDFESKVTKNFTLYAKWDKHDDEQSSTDTHNCPSLAFDDLDITKWYHFDTDYVIENGIFKGTTETTFEPDSAQTRAMMVTVLYRVEGEPAVNRSIPFADVDMGAYYANAVIWGQQNGIIKGYSETEFGPDDKITREQIAAIMHRYSQYKGYDVSVGENTNILSYDDFDSISEYAIPSMQWAVGSGLIKGKSESTLNPLDNATRAEIAAILHRFIEANK